MMNEYESDDGFMDFTLGEGDDDVGKKGGRFTAKDDTTYRVSFVWLSVLKDGKWDDDAAFLKDGTLNPEASIRFTGCERIYKQGVGYILYKGPAFAQFGKPRQAVATIICVWPTNDDGELQVEKFAQGKGYAVQPWIFSPDKYKDIKAKHKRFTLVNHDLSLACPENGAEYQKLSFTPEADNLFMRMLASEKPAIQAAMKKILADVRATAMAIHGELARDLSVAEIQDKLGGGSGAPTGNHAAKDVESLLGDLI
jgi:hypothetical protein